MQIELIKAGVGDCRELHEMQRKAFAALLEKYGDFETNPGAEPIECVEQRMTRADTDHYLIIAQGERVGAVRVTRRSERCCVLSRIFVVPKHMGKGVASAAVLAVEELYPSAVLWLLDTVKQEEQLVRLYSRLGYRLTGEEKSVKPGMELVYMDKLKSADLDIVPLTASQLRLWTEDIPALDKELGCTYKAEPMEGVFLDIVKGQCERCEKDPLSFRWHSFYFLIRRSDRVVVGSSDFKYPPNEKGETEIGYGLGEDFRHRGYMTQAVNAMCFWALEAGGVKSVIAETETENLASQAVLERCGFKLCEKGETFWWRLEKGE